MQFPQLSILKLMTLPTFRQTGGKLGHVQCEGTAKLGSQGSRGIDRLDTGRKMRLKVQADLAGLSPYLSHGCFGSVLYHRGCFIAPCSESYM